MIEDDPDSTDHPSGASPTAFRSGFVALVGRPNAGKSTLLNRLVGEKVAIVSEKPQTTRTQIRGFITRPEGQLVFVDTPGVHKPGYELNRRMMHLVSEALLSVDVVLVILDAAARRGAGDRFVEDLVFASGKPVILVLNKVDLVRDKDRLLPMIAELTAEREYAEVVPISARRGTNVDSLVETVLGYLPEGPRYFPDDEYTDQPLRMLAAELVREQILRATGEELPYVTAVVVERWDESATIAKVYCRIFVERESQRGIVIGKGGMRLKEIGTNARHEIEQTLGKQVYLELHVVVRERWRDDERVLGELGLEK
jgi:GTP-binding protein Era